jgi:hypothetical protein
MTAVEAHLRHELEISDYATASIRNSGQVPQRLRTRQLKEEASCGRMWHRLLDNAWPTGRFAPTSIPVMRSCWFSER